MLKLLFPIVRNVISVSSVKSQVTSIEDCPLRVFFKCLCLCLCLCLFVGHVMAAHHLDQMSQRSQVSRVTLWGCSLNVFVFVFVFVSALHVALHSLCTLQSRCCERSLKMHKAESESNGVLSAPPFQSTIIMIDAKGMHSKCTLCSTCPKQTFNNRSRWGLPSHGLSHCFNTLYQVHSPQRDLFKFPPKIKKS